MLRHVGWPVWLWLAVMLGAASSLVAQWRSGIDASADILALLPPGEAPPSVRQALSVIEQAAANRLVLLVGHADADHARRAADQLAEQLAAVEGFGTVTARVDAGRWQAVRDAYAPQTGLLLGDTDRERLGNGEAAAIGRDALRAVYSPGGWVRVLPLAEDPLGIHQRFLQQIPAAFSGMRYDGTHLSVDADGQRWVMVNASLSQAAFGLADPGRFSRAIAAAVDGLRAADGGLTVFASGAPLHAARAAARARWEIGVIGSGSALGVLLLLLLAFRSPRPLLLTLVSIGAGLLVATALCARLFPSLHLITLVIGASLIGVTVDYSFHFFAEAAQRGATPRSALQRIRPAITLGALTTLLGFAGLLLAPFPGLRQMACFAIAGVGFAFLSVLVLHPRLAAAAPPPIPGALMRLAAAVLAMPRALARAFTLLAAALLIAAGFARYDDDVRALYSPPADLIAADRAVARISGSVDVSRLLVVQADSAEQWLRINERLGERIRAAGVARPVTVAAAVPSAARQLADRERLEPIYEAGGELDRFAAATGLSSAARQRLQQRWRNAPTLDLPTWLASGAAPELAALVSEHRADAVTGSLLLADITDEAALRQIVADEPGAIWVDRPAMISSLMVRLRQQAGALILAAYALIAVIVVWRYGWAGGAAVLWVPLGASGAAFGLLTLAGAALNLFHLLSLLLVLGIAVDYAIFLREAASHRVATLLAVLLSALTTLLAFGLLSLSATPALSAFGSVVAIGIPAALLLAAAQFREPPACD